MKYNNKFNHKFFFIILFCLILLASISSAFLINNYYKKSELKVTLEHPFYLNGKWIKASELKVGDELITIDGKKARITNIKKINEPAVVYNLEDSLYNNYVANGVVVHNSNLPSTLSESELSRLRRGDFSEGEIERIERAKQVLKEKGLESDLKLLESKGNQAELLMSHYSGNYPEGGINVFTKARNLLETGFSKEGVQALGDNLVIGTLSDAFSNNIRKTLNGELANLPENTLLFRSNANLPSLEGVLEGGPKKIEFYRGQDLNANEDWGIQHVVYRHMTEGAEHLTRLREGDRTAGLFLESIVDSATGEKHIVMMKPKEISDRIEAALSSGNGIVRQPRTDSPGMIAINYPEQNMYIALERTADSNTFKFSTAVPLQRPRNPDGSPAMSGSAWTEKIMKGKYSSYETTINGQKRTVIVPE